MTHYASPAGKTIPGLPTAGSPTVFVPDPPPLTVFAFTAVPGRLPPSGPVSLSTVPSTGQMWPRGGLLGAAGATGPTGPSGTGATGPTGPSGLTVVSHGTNGATARPAGAVTVYWVGSAIPANALPNDLWKDV